jgi:hypothetical protein
MTYIKKTKPVKFEERLLQLGPESFVFPLSV